MNVIHDLVNIGHCAQNGISGTSNDFCPLDISRIKKLLRFPYGYKFADDFEPTEDNFNLLIQSGVITPLYTIDGANFTTEADGIQTIDGGKNKLIEKFPYKIEAKLYNGIQGFQNTLTIANANAHSFLIVDVKGTIFGTKGKDGKFRPINSEFLHVGAYVGAGAEAAYYMIDFQLDRNQFDTGLSGLRTDDYDFEIDDIKGFTNLEISISTAPVTGDTGFSFKVLRKEDRVAQLGLSNIELKVYVDGVAVISPTISTATAQGVYTVSGLTAFTLGQVVQVKTNDGTYNVVDLAGVLMKSNEAQTVVVAP